jgi:hypothetical protein
MKYIMYKRTTADVEQLIPIIFPNDLIHKFVNEAILNHPEHKNMVPISAGECNLDCNGVGAGSVSLGLHHVQSDAYVITSHDYAHGLF